MKELIDALRLGATISRERGIYQDYCLIADHAADTIERLEHDLVAADIRIENDALELAELALNGPRMTRGVSLDDTSKSWMGSMRDVMNDYKQAAECEAAEVDRLSSEIDGLTREQVGLKLDAARLEWAMNNMCQHNYTLFGMHVMNVGGTGDIHDCRSFIDSMKGGV